MTLNVTHTYVLMELPPDVYALIEQRLREAGYTHAIGEDGELDMHGIALSKGLDLEPKPTRAAGLHCATCQCNKLHPTPPVVDAPLSRSWHDNTERKA